MIELTGSRSQITFPGIPDPADDQVWDVSLEKIKLVIPWEPVVSLDAMILEYADYLRNRKI